MTTPERTPQQVGICGACCDGDKIYLTQFLLSTETFFSPNFVETEKKSRLKYFVLLAVSTLNKKIITSSKLNIGFKVFQIWFLD